MTRRRTELARGISIVGVGCTPFGDLLETPELLGMTERELVSWAAIDAMEDAGLTSKDIDAFFVGHCLDEQVAGSINTAPAVADWIGMRNKPGLHHEAGVRYGWHGSVARLPGGGIRYVRHCLVSRRRGAP